MLQTKEDLKKLYEKDYYGWILENINLLKEKDFENLDVENLIEELEGMSKSVERELISYLSRLMVHIYKWENFPNLRSKSWRNSIIFSQEKIYQILKKNPSLKHKIDACLLEGWQDARFWIGNETDKDIEDLPKENPYTLDYIMNYNPKKEDIASWPYNR
ncbi:DUF29 domain-containing protein [Sulfurihydrogenibium sp.]|uniref:DUF29 domain-containing protein n=1 Tax=Sulfurihydrogenibium sp. TaxID=2053621 RepID=UPI00261EA41A|nr:DUF29 domain-containing protein [Sulfurihydrogenibium sp.]